VVPQRYPTLVRGQERSRQKRLGWWDRFQTADGVVPSVARLVVAGGILAVVLGFGGAIGHPTVTLLNGLAVPVSIELDGQSRTLAPYEHRDISLARAKQVQVSARSPRGELIETFKADATGSQHYVYNVASATSLVQWTAVYGSAQPVPERQLGATRWFVSSANIFFEEPPKSLSTSSSSGGGTKTVLSAFPEDAPFRIIGAANPNERSPMIQTHALWDAPESRHLVEWLQAGIEQGDGPALLRQRLSRYPSDMSALRLQQDVTRGEAKPELCAQARAQSEAQPNDLDLLYLALRCPEEDEKLRQAVLDAYRAHPEHAYLANAAGRELQRQRDYAGAVRAFTIASGAPPLSDFANLELGRLARIQGLGSVERLKALASSSTALTSLLALETSEGVDTDSPELAFSLLARGELDAAVAKARARPHLLALVLPLAAASDGASTALVDEALGMLEQVKDPAALWPSIALAERELRPHAALDAVALARERATPQLLKFANAQFLKGDPAGVEAELWSLPAEAQPFACVMALVRVNAAAPDACRDFAKAALFAPERPYFH
jgi:hypothetical protein